MRKIAKTMFLIFTSILFVQCVIAQNEYIKNEKEDYSVCGNAATIAVLKNEPAYIKESCYSIGGKKHFFVIVLITRPNVEYHFSTTIYPYQGVPEKFQKNDLSVLISGNILDCRHIVACEISPNARYAPSYLFELKTIKKR